MHRSLGRHISIVKHLRHSPWPATLLQVGADPAGTWWGGGHTCTPQGPPTPRHPPGSASPPQMVHTLASNGANSIWEHSLLDPAQVQSGRRKANPQDKVQ